LRLLIIAFNFVFAESLACPYALNIPPKPFKYSHMQLLTRADDDRFNNAFFNTSFSSAVYTPHAKQSACLQAKSVFLLFNIDVSHPSFS